MNTIAFDSHGTGMLGRVSGACTISYFVKSLTASWYLLRNGFSIHGLWPDYGNGTWPEYCDKESHLNATAIADLKTAMEKKWPSLTGETP